jgi:hypothetical protein
MFLSKTLGFEGAEAGGVRAKVGQRWCWPPRRPRRQWRGTATRCSSATMTSVRLTDDILPLWILCSVLGEIVLIMC